MKDMLNARVKHRSGFRPFAPSILENRASEFFEWTRESPFMLFAAPVKSEHAKTIPAVLHVDGTARLQTVGPEADSRFHELIMEFDKQTGVPLVLNTSFNDAGEPIVETPKDAIGCYLNTDIDCLILGDYLVSKSPEDYGD